MCEQPSGFCMGNFSLKSLHLTIYLTQNQIKSLQCPTSRMTNVLCSSHTKEHYSTIRINDLQEHVKHV